MKIAESEFAVLRQTIAARGTLRIVLTPATFIAWAALAAALTLFSDLPVAALLSLAVLVAGFEAIHAIHVGVERIGRYVQVYYEEAAREEPAGAAPQWETTATQVGPALPGGGVDPLFSVLFLSATVLNMIPVMLPEPQPIEIGVLALLHVMFVIRVIRARVAAAKQRAVELDRYRALLLRERDRQ